MRAYPSAILWCLTMWACSGSTHKPADEDTSDSATTDSSATQDTDSAADTASDTAADTADPDCADAPAVTWNTWGQGFLLGHCQGCHATSAAERYGAPPEVAFDTVDMAWTHAPAILRTVATDPTTMPPAGGVDDVDKAFLVAWLHCGTPGT